MSESVAYVVPGLPDPNDVMLDFLIEQFPEVFTAANTNIEPPATGLATNLPFGVSFHWGGDVDRFGGDVMVDLSIFAATYRKARDLARSVEDRLVGYPFRVSSGGRSVLVDKVEIASPTVEVPWQEDSDIRRFQGTYRLSIRR